MAWSRAKRAIVSSVMGIIAAGTTPIVIERHNDAKQYLIVREPWSDIGAATPKAALQSLAWALTNDKVDRAQALIQWDENGVEFGGDTKIQQQLTLMSVLAPALKDVESFKIVSINRTRQAGELLVKIEKGFKNGNIRPFAVTTKLRRVNGQWRVVANIEYFENGSTSTLLPFTGSF
jgi:hypothetical protein